MHSLRCGRGPVAWPHPTTWCAGPCTSPRTGPCTAGACVVHTYVAFCNDAITVRFVSPWQIPSQCEKWVSLHIDFLPRLIPSMSLLKEGSSTKVNGWTLSITNSQISWLTLFCDTPKLLFYSTNKTCTPMYAFVLFWNICFGKSMFVQVVINKWGSIPLKIICDLLLITIQMWLLYRWWGT